MRSSSSPSSNTLMRSCEKSADARHERVKLLLDTPRDTILDNTVDVFVLVLLRDRDVRAAGLELDGDHLTETLFGGGEGLVDDVGDVVLTITRP